ncbi:MAG: hypothetical protein NT062_26830, partial [Proteobacteria bacterium]|nr:hypothetical protein [Pseudomonadota bacterium]
TMKKIMNCKTLLTLSLVSLVAASTTIAAADSQISIGSSVRALRSDSANALTTESLGGGALTYGYQLPIATIPHLALWAEASMGWGTAAGALFQTLTTSIDTFDLGLAARARYELHPRVAVSARLGLGTSRESIAIADAMGHRASDDGLAATTTASLALDLLAIDLPRFGLGLRAELGYTAASDVDLTTSPDRPSDGTIKLPLMDAAFGHLDLGGPFFGFGLFGRF